MNYAIIENGVVVNIIVGLPDGMDGVCVDELDVAIGDRYENGEFIKANPPEEVPALVDPVAEYVASMSESAFERLPAGMRELLSSYR
jgi:hypothetical protein